MATKTHRQLITAALKSIGAEMSTKTYRQLTISAFDAIGAVETRRTAKYVGFDYDGRTYLIGKSGALRVVRIGKPIANSISLTGNRFHRALLTVGSRAVDGMYTTAEQAVKDLQMYRSAGNAASA